jgi:hypothetical protein
MINHACGNIMKLVDNARTLSISKDLFNNFQLNYFRKIT